MWYERKAEFMTREVKLKTQVFALILHWTSYLQSFLLYVENKDRRDTFTDVVSSEQQAAIFCRVLLLL